MASLFNLGVNFSGIWYFQPGVSAPLALFLRCPEMRRAGWTTACIYVNTDLCRYCSKYNNNIPEKCVIMYSMFYTNKHKHKHTSPPLSLTSSHKGSVSLVTTVAYSEVTTIPWSHRATQFLIPRTLTCTVSIWVSEQCILLWSAVGDKKHGRAFPWKPRCPDVFYKH